MDPEFFFNSHNMGKVSLKLFYKICEHNKFYNIYFSLQQGLPKWMQIIGLIKFSLLHIVTVIHGKVKEKKYTLN